MPQIILNHAHIGFLNQRVPSRMPQHMRVNVQMLESGLESNQAHQLKEVIRDSGLRRSLMKSSSISAGGSIFSRSTSQARIAVLSPL